VNPARLSSLNTQIISVLGATRPHLIARNHGII
jgi:hypothetical protein